MKPLETADVAKALNLSPGRVRQLADTGRLPVAMRTARGRRLFEAEAVRRLVRERRETGRGRRRRTKPAPAAERLR